MHEHYTMQKRLAENGYWVYDFCLPMLCLQARLAPAGLLDTPVDTGVSLSGVDVCVTLACMAPPPLRQCHNLMASKAIGMCSRESAC